MLLCHQGEVVCFSAIMKIKKLGLMVLCCLSLTFGKRNRWWQRTFFLLSCSTLSPLSLSLTHTLKNTRTHTYIPLSHHHTHSLTLLYTRTTSLSHTLPLSHAVSLSNTLPLSHAVSLSNTLPLSHIVLLALSLTPTLIHTPSSSPTLSILFLVPWQFTN